MRKAHARHAPTVHITYTDFDYLQIEFTTASSLSAFCINGTWPLLHSAQAANALSPLGTSHAHAFISTVVYFMPDGFPGAQHSGPLCPQATTLPPMTHALGASEGPLVPLPGVSNASLLQGDLSCESQLQSATHLFLRDSSNNIWTHDPRMQLLANTLEEPYNGSVSGAAPPLVAKTFLNEHHCVPIELSTRTGYTDATFQLSRPMLRNFYTQDDPRLVYYVDNLRLEDPYDVAPCNGTSRWRSRAGACVAESAIDAVTKENLVAAIAEGSSEGGEVLDLELQEACASESSEYASGSDTSLPIAAMVTVNGACWEHSHPDQLNVYDFTWWATAHPGGSAAIKQFARRGSVALLFPSWHSMKGGEDNSAAGGWEIKHLNFPYLGRLGDVVDFQLLEPSLRSASIAELVGSEPVYTESFEVCGSPGEVANAPAESNRYSMLLTNDDARPGDSYPMDVTGYLSAAEAGVTTDNERDRLVSYNRVRTGAGAGASGDQLGTPSMRQGKNIAWTAVALRAEDQLRQRVAWALYQIFVISDAGGMKFNEVPTIATSTVPTTTHVATTLAATTLTTSTLTATTLTTSTLARPRRGTRTMTSSLGMPLAHCVT